MRWVMEYDLLGELATKLSILESAVSSAEGESVASVASQAPSAAA
jgi:hypothetical protein